MLKKLASLLAAERADLGKQGEDKACAFLKKHGYKILERNWKSRPHEIDIVCLDGNTGELVFAEVKTRSAKERENALEAFTEKKQRNTVKAAQKYLTEKQKWDCPCRFDLICVSGKDLNVEHFTNVIIQ